MKRVLVILVCLLYALSATGFAAVTDKAGPVISNITVSCDSLLAGETLTITCEVTDDAEIESVSYSYFMVGASMGHGWVMEHVSGNLYSVDLVIPKDTKNGSYWIQISAKDIYENYSSKSVSPAFSVFGGISDQTEPVISNISLSSKNIQAGETLTLTCEVTDESEIERVSYSYFMIGASNGHGWEMEHVSGNLYRADILIPAGTRSGNYWIQVSANDVYENYGSKSVSPAFTVVGVTDQTAPVISNITINNEAPFQSGEILTIICEVTDESEIENVSYSYFMMGASMGHGWNMEPVSGNRYRANITIPADIRVGDYWIQISTNDIYENYGSKTVSPAFSVEMTSTDVDLPNKLNSIGEEAFSGTNSEYYALPSGITSIASRTFANLRHPYARIYVPASVVSIADDAFANSSVVIVAPANSYAIQWAKAHGVIFRIKGN